MKPAPDMDTIVREFSVLPWAHELNGARRLVILELMRSVGVKRFRAWDDFLAAMAQRDFDEAAHVILNSNFPDGDADEWALMMRTGVSRYVE